MINIMLILQILFSNYFQNSAIFYILMIVSEILNQNLSDNIQFFVKDFNPSLSYCIPEFFCAILSF